MIKEYLLEELRLTNDLLTLSILVQLESLTSDETFVRYHEALKVISKKIIETRLESKFQWRYP